MITYSCTTTNPQIPNQLWNVHLTGFVRSWENEYVTVQNRKDKIPVLRITVTEPIDNEEYTFNIWGVITHIRLNKILHKDQPISIRGTARTDWPKFINVQTLEFKGE